MDISSQTGLCKLNKILVEECITLKNLHKGFFGEVPHINRMPLILHRDQTIPLQDNGENATCSAFVKLSTC